MSGTTGKASPEMDRVDSDSSAEEVRSDPLAVQTRDDNATDKKGRETENDSSEDDG